MVDGIDIAIDDFRQQLADIKQRLAEFRKKGKYTKIAEMRIVSIPAKIKMLEATRELKDVAKVNRMIDEANKEASFIENDGYKVEDEKDPFLELVKIAGKIKEEIKAGKKKDVIEMYNNAQNLYKSVQQNYKKEAYLMFIDIHKRLSSK